MHFLNDGTVNFFTSLLCKTNRFYVVMRHFFFLPHFDVICALLLKRCMAMWNLFVIKTDTM